MPASPLSGPAGLLGATALLHVALAVACGVALVLGWGGTLTGVPAALKPFKFMVSAAVMLAALAVLLPRMTLGPFGRWLFAGVVAGTLVVESGCILVQAARGTTSHFNTATAFDAAVWSTMASAIALLTLAMLGAALVATARPLHMPGLLAAAWRAGLWIFLFAAASGYGMAGRGQHTVGAPDGGAGLPLLNWSLTHGDLRVSHFLALHALQALPLLAWGLLALPVPNLGRGLVLGAATLLLAAAALLSFAQALGGRPLLRGAHASRFLDAAPPSVGGPGNDGHDGLARARGAPPGDGVRRL